MFKMNGVVYHRIGPLLPAENFSPKFAQLYMVDSADEVQSRIDVFSREDGGSLDPDPEIVAALITMLNTHHRLVHKFRLARQSLCSVDAPKVSIRFLGDDGGSHGTRFSGPSAGEVAALIVGDLTPQCRKFDVVVESHSGVLKHISALNCNLMALQYPLLFPYGDKSYHLGIKYVDASKHSPSTIPGYYAGVL